MKIVQEKNYILEFFVRLMRLKNHLSKSKIFRKAQKPLFLLTNSKILH